MSHAPERKEKNCLNCNANLIGRFCHVCGQENVVVKESFLKLVTHFFYDITHFDTNFFHTLKYLVFRPGFLSKEYLSGKRASYLNPVRMYVFTSAIFFLFFFTVVRPKPTIHSTANEVLTQSQRDSLAPEIQKEFGKPGKDSNVLNTQMVMLHDTNRSLTRKELVDVDKRRKYTNLTNTNYLDLAEYDSAQHVLPASSRDGWWRRTLVKRDIEINERMRENPDNTIRELIDFLLHRLPYLLFISLPLFALILKLLYVRRKNFFYADHAIFTIHHYIFSFILLLLIFLLDTARQRWNIGWLGNIELVLFFAWPLYLYIGMKKFYGQGWGKTFLKFLLVNLLGIFLVTLLLVLFFFLSIFQI